MWDFAGQEEYYVTHQCFISEFSLYLIVWDIREKENGVRKLKPWLETIFARAENFSLIFIATKIDLLEEERYLNFNEMKSEIINLLNSIPGFHKSRHQLGITCMFLSLIPSYSNYNNGR